MSHKIVGIGACVMDTLFTLPHYPKEDTKLRATSAKPAGGGPTATGIVAAAKLGESAAFIGVLSSDNGGKFLMEDFAKYNVSTDLITVEDGYRSFTSSIWLSEEGGSRTCVFDKGDLPPLHLNDAQKEAVANAEILMIDGNEMAGALEACAVAKENGTKILYDCGGLYEGVANLLKQTDYMIPSEEFSLGHTGKETVEEAAKALFETYRPEVVVITRGSKGGLYYDGTEMLHYPVFPVTVLDSNGSGDVFHGAFAAGLAKGLTPKQCCYFSSAVSAIKCTGVGARESVPDYNTVLEFLKERNYEL